MTPPPASPDHVDLHTQLAGISESIRQFQAQMAIEQQARTMTLTPPALISDPGNLNGIPGRTAVEIRRDLQQQQQVSESLANLNLTGPPIGTPMAATPPPSTPIHGIDASPVPPILNPAPHQVTGNNHNLIRIQNEQNAKNMAMEPRTRLDKDKQLNSDADFGLLTLHFQELKSQLSRKLWNSTMESWALAQIVPKSPAYTLIRTALFSRSEHPVTRCYFSSLEHYQAFVVTTFFTGRDPMHIIEDFCEKILLDNPKKPVHPPGSHVTYTTVTFANLYREAQSYAPADDRIAEKALVGRIRAKLPPHVKETLSCSEDIGLQAITTYPALMRVLSRIDRQFAAKFAKVSAKDLALNAIDDEALNKMSGNGDKTPSKNDGDKTPSKKCTHCGKNHPSERCYKKYPHLRPKPKGKGKGKGGEKNPFHNFTKGQDNALLALITDKDNKGNENE